MLSKDPCLIAEKVPQWLADKKIASFARSNHVKQALQGASIIFVRDLSNTSLVQLAAVPISTKALFELGGRLQRASERGERDFKDEDAVHLPNLVAKRNSLKKEAVSAVLNASPMPLHYKQIAAIATELMGTNVSEGYVMMIAREEWWLFKSGIYALERHLPVGRAALVAVGTSAANIIISGPTVRQWHTTEILRSIAIRDPDLIDGFDEYLLDIALQMSLQMSKGLVWLRRMTWTVDRGGPRRNDESVRIRQQAEIIAILESAGESLAETEIRERLRITRGIGPGTQIFPEERLVRIGDCFWGLNDRDLTLKKPDQPSLLGKLHVQLQGKGHALHKSELGFILIETGLSVEAIFSLCQLDNRFQIRAGYLFLREWGEPRRETCFKATLAVITTGHRKLTLSEITDEVATIVRRKVKRITVQSALYSIGAIKDENKRWSLKQ